MTALAASRTSRVCALVALAGSLLAGCGRGSSPSPAAPTNPVPTITALIITPVTGQITSGVTFQLTATAVRSDGQTVTSGLNVQWTSTNEQIATVERSGRVTTRKEGNVTIEATSGTLKAIAPIQVVPW